MGAIPANLRLAMPKGWPNFIRSAAIHVISLAHFSVTFARSVAANSINARIRLNTDNSRLRQEIALLIAVTGPSESSDTHAQGSGSDSAQ